MTNLSSKLIKNLGGAEILSEGSTTARSLEERFADVVNVKDFGAVGDGVTDDTSSLQSAIDNTSGGFIEIPQGTYILSGTLLIRGKNIILRGVGQEVSVLIQNSSQDYAVDLFSLAAQTGTMGVEKLGIRSKYGIKTRYDHDTSWETDSSPIKHIRINDCKFEGTYDDVADPDAGTSTITDRVTLDNEGVGLQLSTTYRSEVLNNEFYRYGIGINDSGNTLTSIRHNRFQKCARHIHSERTEWQGSSFGLGADSVIELNDFIDATHGGGVSLFNTFGLNFRNNYMEHLDRSGSDSSPVLLYGQNMSHVSVEDNHFNAFLSYDEGTFALRFYFNDNMALGETSNNRLFRNRITPNVNVGNTYIKISTEEYDRRYPSNLHIYANSEIFPLTDSPYVINGESVDYSFLAYNNIGFHHNLGGNVADNTLLFSGNGNTGWHLPSSEPNGGVPNLTFDLRLSNYGLGEDFNLIIVADDEPSPSNGRLFTTVKDEEGNTLFNDYAFNGQSGLARTVVPLTSPSPVKLNKQFSIDFNNMSFSRIYYVGIEPA